MVAGASRTAGVLLVAVLAACVVIDPPNGALRCSVDGRCPHGYYCATDDACWRNGTSPAAANDGGAAFIVAHLASSAATPGSSDLMLAAGDSTIDTGALTVTGGLPAGASFVATAQTPLGPELAVLHVRRFVVASGVAVRVVGSRPLVVVAGDDVTIDGVIDAGARAPQAGAGGHAPGTGVGAGGTGAHVASAESGGGGAGFGGTGARGGNGTGVMPSNPGGVAGGTYGDDALTVLEGGAGGGLGTGGCFPAPGGAGGGAVQVSSTTRIVIGDGGGIQAGGGGGSESDSSCSPASGGGGGAGGAIFLQAPVVQLRGTLAANGGGGAAGVPKLSPSYPGHDGALSAQPAAGGVGGPGGAGGAGASALVAPGTGTDNAQMPGGGGGGVGRIRVVSDSFTNMGVSSPAASTASLSGISGH